MPRKPTRAQLTASRRETFYLAQLAGQNTPSGRLAVAAQWVRAACAHRPKAVVDQVVTELVTAARRIGAEQ